MRGFLFSFGIYLSMKIVLTESQLNSIIKKTLIVEKYKSSVDYAAYIRDTLRSIYEPLGLWGQAPNPNEDCQTGEGVINVFPHSKKDKWSVLNRFDTNRKVKTRIQELYVRFSRLKHTEKNFYNWIEKNKMKLFGPDGKYTQELVNLNMDTIISGNKNEEYAVKVLQERFPDAKIRRYCSGDLRDTQKGIDITIESAGGSSNVQVKPFITVSSFVEPDGDTFFEVKSYLEANRYSEKNVNIFMFVDHLSKKYILFVNKKNKIGQMAGSVLRFYEPPLMTNMTFITKEKRKSKKSEPTTKLFGIETDILKNLEFRKSQIEKMIEKQKTQNSK